MNTTATTPRVLFVANPTAQSGRARPRIERAAAAMRSRGWDVAPCDTEADEGTVPKVAARLDDEGFDVVVYMGGDGTFREAAMGLLASSARVPLGMLPSGTANDQGKSFGVSSDEGALEDNLDVIARGFTVQLDAGEVRVLDAVGGEAVAETMFFDSVGFGLFAEVLRRRNQDRELVDKIPVVREVYRDQLVYAGALLEKYLESFAEDVHLAVEVLVDHEREPRRLEGLVDLVIKNTAIFGGEWVLDRTSEPDDGKMEAVPFVGRRDWLSRAIRDLRGLPIWQEHLNVVGLTHVPSFSGARFDLTFDRAGMPDVMVQVDGEEWRYGRRFIVTVFPGELPLIVPEGFVPSWRKEEAPRRG